MPNTIKVHAIPGVMQPHEPPRRGHVGYRVATADETPDRCIGNVVRLKHVPGVHEVPDTVFYRRACVSGDLIRDEDMPRVKNALTSAPVANDVHAAKPSEV